MDISKMKTRLQTLIGSSLKFNTVIPELEPLTLWSLPNDEYETVIQCLVDMRDQKKPISVSSLITACKTAGDFNYIAEWENTVKDCVQMITHTERVKAVVDDVILELVRELLIVHANNISEAARDSHSDVEKLTDVLEDVVMSIRNKRSAGDGNDSDEAVTAIEQSIIDFKSGKKLPFIPSGIKELDFIFKGFGNSELITIGARTGVGKTAFVTGLGLDQSRRGYRVGIVSLEMDGQSMMKRLTQQYCGIDIDYLMANDDLKAEDELLFVNSMRAVKELPLSLICPKNMQVSNIKNICRRMKHSDDVDIIYIDYLQKIQAKAHSREGEIAVASEAMRLMAKELGIPIVQLVQLNRTAEDNTPTLAHIRESGSAEQDSQKVLLIDRKRNNGNYQDCTIIVAKNRTGRVGKAQITFMGGACKFVSKVRIEESDVPKRTSEV